MKTLFALFSVLMVGCVSGSVEATNVCSSKEYPTLVGGLSGKTDKPISRSDTHDFSEVIGKVGDFGDVEFSLTTATLASKENLPLSFIDSLRFVYVDADGKEELLGNSGHVKGNSVTMNLTNTSAGLQNALRSGPITLKLTGEGKAPDHLVTPVFTVCASAKANVNASLADAFQ